nr:glutamate--tRNA ligase [Pyrolobus fumarii]
MSFDEREVREVARAYALLNAVQHGGKASVGAVMGKVMAERPEWRSVARQIVGIVREVVEEVNKLSLEEQKRLLEEKYSWVLEKTRKPRAEEKKLPPLPEAEEGKVVTRFAPNPDFVIHLGNARPAILSHEYARMYKGKFILRFEDTDPRTKRPMIEAYSLIKEDLEWLGIKWDEEYVQSLRMEIYYDIARKLIEKGGAYVDDQPAEKFREYRDSGKLAEYPPRRRSPEENLELWDKMLEGAFGEGEAVLRVKTDPSHPDPSVRDWVAFRIIDTSRTPHPLVGDRYIVWPTYNFAAAVDDHLMGVTHILRAKEHMQNTVKQKFLYQHLGWKYPHVIHFGRLKLEGFIMSKSVMKKLMEEGFFLGIDDPRFGTIAGLRRRGIDPDSIRKLILDVGVKGTDASISYANLAAVNRSIIDPKAKRFMVVFDPVEVVIQGIPGRIEANIPFHPERREMGSRVLVLPAGEARVYLPRRDIAKVGVGGWIRLAEAINIEIVSMDGDRVVARYKGTSLDEARARRAPIVQWVPAGDVVEVTVFIPEGLRLRVEKGVGEPALREVKRGDIVQFLREGFYRVDAVAAEQNEVVVIYAHD